MDIIRDLIAPAVILTVFSLWAKWISIKFNRFEKFFSEFKLLLEKEFVRISKFDEQNKLITEQMADAKMSRANIWAAMNERTKESTELIYAMKLELSNKITEIITILKMQGHKIESQQKDKA